MIRRPSPFRRRRDPGQPETPESPFSFAPPTEAPLASEETQPTAVFGAAGVAETAPRANADLPANPSFRDRGRYRRRLRYLRRVRELGFRDLGGLVFDQYRFSRAGEQLVRGKLVALDAVDRELRARQRAVNDRRTYFDLREPGIAACPRCAGLHGSDARFCPSCGMRLSGPTAVAEVGDAPPAPAIITNTSPAPGESPLPAAEPPGAAPEAAANPFSTGTATAEQPTTEQPASEQPTTVADPVQPPDHGSDGQ